MSAKNSFIALIFSALVFIASNSFGSIITTNKAIIEQSKTQHFISQDKETSQKGSLIKINAVLELLIKVNKDNANRFSNLKSNKKRFNPYFLLLAFLFSGACYTFYCAEITNKIKYFPLYISYRSLII